MTHFQSNLQAVDASNPKASLSLLIATGIAKEQVLNLTEDPNEVYWMPTSTCTFAIHAPEDVELHIDDGTNAVPIVHPRVRNFSLDLPHQVNIGIRNIVGNPMKIHVLTVDENKATKNQNGKIQEIMMAWSIRETWDPPEVNIGPPGPSAYEVAKETGYSGTLKEWLDSLKGDRGQSAYQLAVEAGFKGTKSAWLASLGGAQGQSAYQLAVKQGYVGSEAEWVHSLKGENGENGEGAFALARRMGFEGSEQEWLDNIKGTTVDVDQYLGKGIPSVRTPDPNNPAHTGNVTTFTEAMNHLFMLASSGKKAIIDAGKQVGLPMKDGMSHREIALILDSIASVGFQIKARSSIPLKKYIIPWIVDDTVEALLTSRTPIAVSSTEPHAPFMNPNQVSDSANLELV